jgi:hypothetical protein
LSSWANKANLSEIIKEEANECAKGKQERTEEEQVNRYNERRERLHN